MATSLGIHELTQRLTAAAYGIWRKRWWMLVTAWIICLLGWAIVLAMPYKYQSYARIFVDAETLLPSIARNLGIDVDVTRQVDVVRRTLVTRNNLEKIIQRILSLEKLATTEVEKDELIAYLRQNIRVSSLEGGLFRIQFEIDEPRLNDRERADVARLVVVNLVSYFLERNSEEGLLQTASAEGFIAERVEEYQKRLEESERRHAAFKQDNLEFLGGQGSFLSRLEDSKNNLKLTLNAISELNATIDALDEQRSSVPPTLREPISARNGGNSAARDPLEERIAELEKRYDDYKSIGYTDRHPDVVNVTRQISTLKEQYEEQRRAVEEELKNTAETGAKSNLTIEVPNKLYESLSLELITKKTEIAALEKRRDDQSELIAQMEEKAKRVPEIEAEEQRLSRDYNSIRQQYNEFVNQQQDLEIRRGVENSGDAVALNVVEEPTRPSRPSGPPRLLYMVGSLLGGIVAGIGVAFMMSQLRPVIITVEQLRAQFDLPVLGNVTKTLSDEENRKRSIELVFFVGTSLLLFGTFAALLAFDFLGGPSLG
ncbi:XrtA system polysaccharide chain length determinant [Kordiimonas sp. SCSIO 12610]|uniref:XrtA system polysaccharide chain length determinant n=1 Tax=Kordiimonas sp. SCSIO 12610 TaxID=2829597 RepID=UPI00210B1836|nr:XrtA system polysaccharide chain length determinant [Kordiimonas sp. SCSIO 12610]UTW54156.1 hypothetical protein KFF44_09975 [Kordiimonas sp. SCSIO 12610]